MKLLPLQEVKGVQEYGSIPKRPIAKTAPKILISKKIVQNGPLHCPKRPIIQPKRPIAKSKTAHSYIQNGPLSLSQGCRGYGDSRGYGYGMGMGIKIQSPRQPCIIGIRQRPNFQSDLEILYVEASYTRVRGLDDSETVKCSAMHYCVTCSKFKSVNATFPTQIPHKFNHESHVQLRNNIRLSTAIIVTFCRDYYIHGARPEFNTVRPST